MIVPSWRIVEADSVSNWLRSVSSKSFWTTTSMEYAAPLGRTVTIARYAIDCNVLCKRSNPAVLSFRQGSSSEAPIRYEVSTRPSKMMPFEF